MTAKNPQPAKAIVNLEVPVTFFGLESEGEDKPLTLGAAFAAGLWHMPADRTNKSPLEVIAWAAQLRKGEPLEIKTEDWESFGALIRVAPLKAGITAQIMEIWDKAKETCRLKAKS